MMDFVVNSAVWVFATIGVVAVLILAKLIRDARKLAKTRKNRWRTKR